MSKTGSLRTQMPETAAFIDAMRDAFGADEINAAIRAGLDGQPLFWAKENGHEVGTPMALSLERSVRADERATPFHPPPKRKS